MAVGLFVSCGNNDSWLFFPLFYEVIFDCLLKLIRLDMEHALISHI